MITVGLIRNGASYLIQHLRKNDYWHEGENEVQGEWIGEGARLLGLEGGVTAKCFEALRRNRHPNTGKALTARDRANRVAFFDIQLSAPKDVSVLAMVGGDERIRTAFVESVKTALAEMERYAAVRERRGEAAGSEQIQLTGNFVGGLFVHDTSRDLDPQLHAHAVLANASWYKEQARWLALKQNEMLRASPYIRQVLYRELASKLQALGYEPYDMSPTGFSIRGMEHLRERFSKRSKVVQKLAEEFAVEHGRKATKREVEVLVRESRQKKLTEISTPEVRSRQRSELTEEEAKALDGLTHQAKARAPRIQLSHGNERIVLEAAMKHVYERRSVAREGEVLAAALELHPDFFRWQALRQVIDFHPDVIRQRGEMSLHTIRREEAATVERIKQSRNQRFAMGDPSHLPATLTAGQARAARELLEGRDFVSVLIGDAGTGKTTVLTAIEAAHVASGGRPFLALGPTTRARDGLRISGFKVTDTVQRFLVSEELQKQIHRRVVLVDEAGLLSTQQLEQLTRITHERFGRVVLVGDTKQHYSVQRGDALRNVIKHSDIPIVRLAEVLRQRNQADRRFSKLLASGDVVEAFQHADRRGMIKEADADESLFAQAAEHYASNRTKGIDTLVVIPFWEEIDRFNARVRPALRRAGLLGEAEVNRTAVRPLTWTEEQKVHWDQYQLGDRLLFARHTKHFKRGSAAEVIGILSDGVQVRGADGREAKIERKLRGTFDVGRLEILPLSAGDKILIQGRDTEENFTNGDFREVAHVDPVTSSVRLTDGRLLPPDFAAWTYGHALTTYRAQGSTAEESLLLLGDVAARSLARRQFYVGNTRYRGAHTIYLSNREAILSRLTNPDPGRELATEFTERQRLTIHERLIPRPMRRLRAILKMGWLADAVRSLRPQQTQSERMGQ